MRDRPTIRSLAERLLRAEREDFFADFWRETERRQLASARRWRRTALVLGAVALAALATAGVVAAPFGASDSVDVHVDCLTAQDANFRGIDVASIPTRKRDASLGRPPEAQLLVSTGGYADSGTKLLQVDAALKGYLVNGSRCAKSKDTAPPRAAGLRLSSIQYAGTPWGHDFRCADVGKVRLSVHLKIGRNGIPAAAQAEVQKLATKRPLLYVDWTPRRVRVYLADACMQTDIGF